ncbi:MAG TPA: hypothetical protein VL728_06565 [Cyclobacteriaceae bacterium]|nr:hypothetical protein [Cyclobacteriaceae bacterium]
MSLFFYRMNSMRMMKWTGSLFFCVMLILDGCSSPESVRISDLSYFPLRVGNYQIYQVSETNIQHASCDDTSQPTKAYELKVSTDDSVKNSEGGYTYLIHRYTRNDSTQSWTDLDTWSARLTANQAIVNEGNTSYVRLQFPLTNNGKWNANLYNNSTPEYDTLRNLGKAYQLSNSKKYSTTLTVIQADNRDFFVFQDKRFEVYAPSVGLIYKEVTQLTYLQGSCYGQQKVGTGLIYSQTLKSTGHD